MSLADVDLVKLQEKILSAYKVDDPIFSEFRQFARDLGTPKKLQRHSVNSVSFVSTDGGDNRLAFNPAAIELVRVVDSNGHECVLDAVASSSELSELDKRLGLIDPNFRVKPLAELCQDLNIGKINELSSLLGGLGQPGKSTGAMRCYRDIVEWAVLYDLVKKTWGSDTVIVRDGLLRTKSFKLTVFPEIDKKIRSATRQSLDQKVNISVVGVAKQNAVLSKLALALELEATFHKPFACYVEVPKHVEEKCYNFDRTWLDTLETSEESEDGLHRYQSMGQLFLVKFGEHEFAPVWPVDVAKWQTGRVSEILGQLMADAQEGFPIPNYPMCIQKAHSHAQLSGFEMNVLQDLMIDTAGTNLSEQEKNRLLKFKYLSQSLAGLRYKK
jgi:hypothetical protein